MLSLSIVVVAVAMVVALVDCCCCSCWLFSNCCCCALCCSKLLHPLHSGLCLNSKLEAITRSRTIPRRASFTSIVRARVTGANVTPRSRRSCTDGHVPSASLPCLCLHSLVVRAGRQELPRSRGDHVQPFPRRGTQAGIERDLCCFFW